MINANIMFSGKLQGTHFRGPLCDFSFSQIYSIDFGEIHQVEINHKYALIQKQIIEFGKTVMQWPQSTLWCHYKLVLIWITYGIITLHTFTFGERFEANIIVISVGWTYKICSNS